MPEPTIRKELTLVEDIQRDGERESTNPTRKVASLAVVTNPYTGRWQDDLGDLAKLGGELGQSLTRAAVKRLGGPEEVESYGKGALIGVDGEVEHGAAILHPEFGGAMREEIDGGDAIIPSVRKLARPETTMDIPTHHVDDPYVLSHLDTMSVSVSDAPKPDELVIASVVTDGGRPHPRIKDLI